jgi:hypothetical protein
MLIVGIAHTTEARYVDAPLPESEATASRQVHSHGATTLSPYYVIASPAAQETQASVLLSKHNGCNAYQQTER